MHTLLSRIPSRAVPALLALPLLASTAAASHHYRLDDGQANVLLGAGKSSDLAWLQSYDAFGGSDTIVVVHVAAPGLPLGTAIGVAVWDDPNEDGDPSDALLLAAAKGAVAPGLDGFSSVTIDERPLVARRFFVGAWTTAGAKLSPAALDTDAAYAGRSWVVWNDVPGGFNAYTLTRNSGLGTVEKLYGLPGVFLLRAEGMGGPVTMYCEAKQNSLGCTPRIDSTGIPSASSRLPFFVDAADVVNRTSGMLVYGTSGRDAVRFAGGTLCVAAPLVRTPVQASFGAHVGADCSGTFSFDFNAWMRTGAVKLEPGTTVNAQYLYRDPGFPEPFGIGTTDAIEFAIAP